jgi:hypothetical protein
MLTFFDWRFHEGQPTLNPGKQKPTEWIQQQISSKPSPLTNRRRTLHATQALSFPGEAPDFEEEGAWLGLRTLFIFVNAAAFREIEINQVRSWLKTTGSPLNSA